ncbi:MAG: HpcH/HpaI aldolase family protein, partial [Planctomycetota bacterium]
MASKSIAQYTAGRESGFHMRPSRVLRRVREGGVARSLKMNGSDPRMVEVFAMSQPDAIWVDMEHVPATYDQLENQVRAAKLYDVDTIVRVPRGSYSDYIKGFEMDATGLMVPHVMGYDDAMAVRDITKFPPIGKRAVDGGNADGGFCRVEFLKYLETANRERFVIYQVEDPEILPDLERIAETEGVDAILFGAGDFSVAIGKPGQLQDPEVVRVRKLVAEVARKHNK